MRYRPSWFLPSPHLRTLWGRFLRARRDLVALGARIERWDTVDGDFIDVMRVNAGAADAPHLVMLHGLEGGARSHYVGGFIEQVRRRGWNATLLIFRGCGDEPNRTRRFYHSGETGDLDLVVRRIAVEFPDAPRVAAGVSLGGNVLLKWLGEQGADAPVVAAATVSVPFDLARSARHIDRGFAKVYQASFMRTLRSKALAKRERFPDIGSADAIRATRNIWDFDDIVTAPVHGFRDAADYYDRSSSIRWIDRIRVPTLLLNARDDPFLPRAVLDDVSAIARDNPSLVLDFPDHGGHVGFVSGPNPFGPSYYGEWRASEFIADQLARRVSGRASSDDPRGDRESDAGSQMIGSDDRARRAAIR